MGKYVTYLAPSATAAPVFPIFSRWLDGHLGRTGCQGHRTHTVGGGRGRAADASERRVRPLQMSARRARVRVEVLPWLHGARRAQQHLRAPVVEARMGTRLRMSEREEIH